MKLFVRRFSALLITAAFLLSACGKGSETPPASAGSGDSQPEQMRAFTDSLGREVQVPANITRVAPSGTVAQLVLYSLAPDKLVGWSSAPTSGMKKYFDRAYTSLPAFGTFYGKNADLNVEALLRANPQVIIDVGEIKDGPDAMIADLDALQQQIGLPVVFVESYLETSGDTYTMLGDLLGVPDQAKALADYCNATVTQAKEKTASLSMQRKVHVYYGDGEDGLQTYPPESFHSEAINLAGAVNVAGAGQASGGGQVSMEQLMLWSPDVILLTAEGGRKMALSDPLWKDLPAVRQGRVYEIPGKPFSWIDRPPAVNRILGVKWLGNLLYPDLFDDDMISEAKTFYQLFYHYELSDDEAAKLMANSMDAE